MAIFHPKSKEGREKKLKLSTRKVKIYVWLPEAKKPVHCFTFLLEVKIAKVSLYASELLPLAKRISFGFSENADESFRGTVIYSSKNPMPSKLDTRYPFKVGIRPFFVTDTEKAKFQAIIDEHAGNIGTNIKAPPTPSPTPVIKQNEDEIFDDEDEDDE